jgi:rubrerythrin
MTLEGSMTWRGALAAREELTAHMDGTSDNFAERAEQENFPNVARLFRAIAYAEQVHAANHFKALGHLGQTADNLQAAIGGETFEVEEMYPAYRAVAELQEEKSAVRTTTWALEAEKVHAGMYYQLRLFKILCIILAGSGWR